MILLQKQGDWKTIERLLNRMEFGTSGLRASIGCGYANMNPLTVIQTTQVIYAFNFVQGVAKVLLKKAIQNGVLLF